MSALGSLLAGIAVAVGGVFIGRKIEQIRASLDEDGLGDARANDQTPKKTIEAEQDPKTGTYHHKHGRGQ